MNTHVACSDEPMVKPDHKAKKHSKPRRGERIGGGHFVFKRGKSGRIHPGHYAFEHPNGASALAEAERLHQLTGHRFDVLSVANCVGDEDYAIGDEVQIEHAELASELEAELALGLESELTAEAAPKVEPELAA